MSNLECQIIPTRVIFNLFISHHCSYSIDLFALLEISKIFCNYLKRDKTEKIKMQWVQKIQANLISLI